MLEVGWSEILVIALILIIVVGPKDLPGMLRNFGKMATRVRSMANDFKGQFDQAMREAELEDVTKGINEVRKLNPTNSLRDAINPLRQLGEGIKSDLQKASDFAPKVSADTGTKVDELASDPVFNPEPVKTEPAANPIPPAAAMPVISPAVAEAKSKKTRKKPDAALQAAADALGAEPVALAPATAVKKAPMRKKAEPAKAEADPFPPPAKKTVTRKTPEKHTEHNVHVVPADTAAAAPARKAAPRKKAAKAGDA
jgi:sec-independent protein translocase protein TatB